MGGWIFPIHTQQRLGVFSRCEFKEFTETEQFLALLDENARSWFFPPVEKRPAPQRGGLRRRGVNFPAEFDHPGAVGEVPAAKMQAAHEKKIKDAELSFLEPGSFYDLAKASRAAMRTFWGTVAALSLLWGTVVVTSEPEQLWDGDLQLQELLLGAASRAVQYSTICECFSVVQSPVCSFHGRRNALYVHWMVIAATSQGPTLAISSLVTCPPTARNRATA